MPGPLAETALAIGHAGIEGVAVGVHPATGVGHDAGAALGIGLRLQLVDLHRLNAVGRHRAGHGQVAAEAEGEIRDPLGHINRQMERLAVARSPIRAVIIDRPHTPIENMAGALDIGAAADCLAVVRGGVEADAEDLAVVDIDSQRLILPPPAETIQIGGHQAAIAIEAVGAAHGLAVGLAGRVGLGGEGPQETRPVGAGIVLRHQRRGAATGHLPAFGAGSKGVLFHQEQRLLLVGGEAVPGHQVRIGAGGRQGHVAHHLGDAARPVPHLQVADGTHQVGRPRRFRQRYGAIPALIGHRGAQAAIADRHPVGIEHRAAVGLHHGGQVGPGAQRKGITAGHAACNAAFNAIEYRTATGVDLQAEAVLAIGQGQHGGGTPQLAHHYPGLHREGAAHGQIRQDCQGLEAIVSRSRNFQHQGASGANGNAGGAVELSQGFGLALDGQPLQRSAAGHPDLIRRQAPGVGNCLDIALAVQQLMALHIADVGGVEGQVAAAGQHGVHLGIAVVLPGLAAAGLACAAPVDVAELEVDAGNQVFANQTLRRVVVAVLHQGQVVGEPLLTHRHHAGTHLVDRGGAGWRGHIRHLQPHQGIAGRTGRIAEVHKAAVELQLEAAGVEHLHRVGRGGGRVGGVGGDQAGAASHQIGVTALVVEGGAAAEAVGQGSAIGPHVAEALAGAVHHQLHGPAKGQALVGQGGAGGHAALLAGRQAQPSIADLPAGAAAVGGHLNLIGHQVEVAGGVYAAGPLHRQAAAGPQGQRAAAHQFAADGHIARKRKVGAALRGGEQVEEALQVEVAAAAQAEIRRRQRRPPQARGAAVQEQGAAAGRAQAGTAAHQRRLAQNLQIASTGAGDQARGLDVAAEVDALALQVDAAAAARQQGGEGAEHATGGSGWHRDGERHQAGCGHAAARRGAGRQGGQLEIVGVVADHPIGHAVLEEREGSLLHPVVDHLAAIGQAVVGNAEARCARAQGTGRQEEG